MGKIQPIPYERFQLDNSDKYSKINALSMALACELSYQNPDFIDSRLLNHWGFQDVFHLGANKGLKIDTQGFAALRSDAVLIAFRGSESPSDWATNFTIVTDDGPFSNTRVHEGFQDALFPVIMDLTETLTKWGRTDLPIWITGHSLGAALATILTGMYLERDRKISGLYTFGSPRVGNQNFRSEFNQRFKNRAFRVVNGNDLVPHVPPEPLFSHVGQLHLFDTQGKRLEGDISAWRRLQIEVTDTLLQDFGDGQLSRVERHLLDDDDGYLPRLLADLDSAP